MPADKEAHKAAAALKKALGNHRGDLSVADAAARSGLSLREAERALFALLETYPSNLKTTSEGELLFSFPKGLSRPRKELSPVRRFFRRAGKALAGAGRFLVRAWIAIALLGYAAIFLGIVIAVTVARLASSSNSDNGSDAAFAVVWVLLRTVLEAMFWLFHPFSPFAVRTEPAFMRGRAQAQRKQKDEVPFYEKVNRFLFGPTEPPRDPAELERRVLAEIRLQRGRIGVSDVMRVTGLTKEAAEPFLARLMLDYEGEVDVSDDGGITYRFPALRKTAGTVAPGTTPRPVWAERLSLGPLTGNKLGENVLIAGLNGFNLLLSLYALSANLTLSKLPYLLTEVPLEALPYDGVPWALGVIPFVFSSALFALPIWRALWRPKKQRDLERENGRRGILRAVLERVGLGTAGRDEAALDEAALKKAWQQAAGRPPDDAELVRQVVALGGDVEISEEGRARYRFRDLEAELAALEAERRAASEAEAEVGEVVFEAEEVRA